MAGGGKNEFLKKQKERDRKFFNAGMIMGVQLVHDYIQMGLRDPDAVGRDIFGRTRIDKLFEVVSNYDDHYSKAFTTDVEADAIRAEMDGKLREIYGDDLVPFEERYPYATQFSYDKPMKGWVE